jgi:hypothetical protein
VEAWRFPERHLLLPGDEKDLMLFLSLHLDAAPLLPFPLSLPGFPFPMLFLLVTCKQRHGRHLAPLIPRFLLLPDVLRRCAALPATSPSKELTRGAFNRRRHHGFLAGNRPPPSSNSSSLAILRPGRPPWRVHGEPPVRPPPFLLLFPRRCARHGRPSPATESRSAWAVAQPTRPAWPSNVAMGPAVSGLGSS